MRVVAGSAKSIKLLSVPGDSTRPILDRVKTALFDTLRPRISDIQVLDLFAGSGSVGIEALSQGAAHCTFIDINPKAISTIQQNLKNTALLEKADVIKADAFAYLKKSRRRFDLIYVAPPQYKALWLESLRYLAERPDLIAENGTVIVQIDPSEYEEFFATTLKESSSRRYGNTLLVWYDKTANAV